jgi:heterodisulfide reductase subunit B
VSRTRKYKVFPLESRGHMFEYRPSPKVKHGRSGKPTQRQLGEISNKVREEVKERSEGLCEVKIKCLGNRAYEMAHITSRKQLTHKTTAADILHSCVECHRWLDSTPDGIRYKRKLKEDQHGR